MSDPSVSLMRKTIKKVFIICESARKDAANHCYIKVVKTFPEKDFDYIESDILMNSSHFNPDDTMTKKQYEFFKIN